MGNCDPLIFLRQDCQLAGVCLNFYAVSNRGTPDSSCENLVAGFAEVSGRKEILVAGACNVPNALIVPFRIELFRPAA